MYLIVDLNITRDEYLSWYRGAAQVVHARSRDGRSVRFPAKALQPYITHSGVAGTFAIYFDDDHKLVGVEKLEGAG